ncbi:hypothetical protein DERP_012107 [Dermatophagoides pteronyssinus]|uniref:Uncharacterized protein n=1 Tax=Dermatophagoides pteronyssinus TaxID=6956 RepID=A0ABQ8ITZ4_DERPT|nr:hypothetical protein DERP_012107 [Dermatophagoides pteronyssinus]
MKEYNLDAVIGSYWIGLYASSIPNYKTIGMTRILLPWHCLRSKRSGILCNVKNKILMIGMDSKLKVKEETIVI